MFNNFFAQLQKVGKSLMLPVSVLPISGILLGIGSAHFSIFPVIISKIMIESGNAVFSNLPLIFSIGVTLGFTKNDGVAALAAVISYCIMVKTLYVVTPLFLHLPLYTILNNHLIDTGILGGIITGSISAFLFNYFHKVQLPDYLGFFSGKRFVPIISGISAIILGIILAFFWPYINLVIKSFSQWAAYQSPLIAFTLYGFVERLLIPIGLHHIWNVPFQMQIGQYINENGQIFHGDIARYMAGDKTAGKLSGGFLVKMFGLPGAALAIWNTSKTKNKKKMAGVMFSAALTSFLTGITEPIEFSFILISPLLYIIHAILSGMAFFICIFFNMKSGTSFSHGLIDFIILSKYSHNIWLFPIIGLLYFFIYYLIFYIIIIKLNIRTPGREKNNLHKTKNAIESTFSICQLVKALGGKENIINLDACITRLRITVNNKKTINTNKIKNLGANGIIIAGRGIQIIFGTKSEIIKSKIEKYIKYK